MISVIFCQTNACMQLLGLLEHFIVLMAAKNRSFTEAIK